jgi:uncharacterized protein with FMN-binding domain
MRKYFLGFIITLVFVAYSVVLRHQHSEPIVPPVSLQNNTTATTTTTTGTATTLTYKDGTYTGAVENAFYGNVQVSATIVSGKITSVDVLQHPNDNPNSIYINQAAVPYLKQEAIQAQSSSVSGVTGATFTSQAFMQSLASALTQAKQS